MSLGEKGFGHAGPWVEIAPDPRRGRGLGQAGSIAAHRRAQASTPGVLRHGHAIPWRSKPHVSAARLIAMRQRRFRGEPSLGWEGTKLANSCEILYPVKTRSRTSRSDPSGSTEMPLPDPLITVNADTMSGAPVFAGTRVPIKTLFDHIEAGDPLSVFLEDFPNVSREHAVAVLELAHIAATQNIGRVAAE